MERGGSGPEATAGAPQLRSPPDRQGVRNYPDPMMPHHVRPCSHCLLLPPASGRIHPDHPTQGAAQTHCPSLKGGHRILAPDKGDPHGLTPGMPPPSRCGYYKPGQPEERSEGCQSISHPIGGSNHMPMQVLSQIGGRPFRPPHQHHTRNQNVPGYRPGDSGGSPPRGEVGQPPFSRVRLGPHRHPQPPFQRGHQAMPGRFQQGRDLTHGQVVLQHLPKIHPTQNSPTSSWSSSPNDTSR
jgi:hypothetical protein